MHRVSGGMSVEQQLVQASNAREQLREAYRAAATEATEEREKLRKLREALGALCASARGKFNDGTYIEIDELQGVLDEHAS